MPSSMVERLTSSIHRRLTTVPTVEKQGKFCVEAESSQSGVLGENLNSHFVKYYFGILFYHRPKQCLTLIKHLNSVAKKFTLGLQAIITLK